MHQSDETYTNLVEFPLGSRGFVFPIQLLAYVNISKLIQFSLEFLPIKVSLVWHTPFLKQHFAC
jgi:hypothetical protein